MLYWKWPPNTLKEGTFDDCIGQKYENMRSFTQASQTGLELKVKGLWRPELTYIWKFQLCICSDSLNLNSDETVLFLYQKVS